MGLFENSHFPYTNFHEMNMDKLVETVESAAGIAEGLGTRVTQAEADIDALEARATTDEETIHSHGVSITGLQMRTTVNEQQIAHNTSDISGLATRVTSAEGQISGLDTQITSIDTQVTTNTNDIASIESDLSTVQDSIDTLTPAVGTLTSEVAAIDNTVTTLNNTTVPAIQSTLSTVSGQVDTNTQDISTIQMDLASRVESVNYTNYVSDTNKTNVGDILIDTTESKEIYIPTVGVDQVLTGGVHVADISVGDTTTAIYAPTAGSTVVRAIDVPFDNTNTSPAMTATECQSAIEEVNTAIGAEATARAAAITAEAAARAALTAGDIGFTYDPDEWKYMRSPNPWIVAARASNTQEAITNAMHAVIANCLNETFYAWDSSASQRTDTTPLSGYLTGAGTDVHFTVPYNKFWFRNDTNGIKNPIDHVSNYTLSINGNVTVRGVGGYIVNNKSLASADFTSVAVIATQNGWRVTLKLATASSQTNNSPVSVVLSNNSYISWIYSAS